MTPTSAPVPGRQCQVPWRLQGGHTLLHTDCRVSSAPFQKSPPFHTHFKQSGLPYMPRKNCSYLSPSDPPGLHEVQLSCALQHLEAKDATHLHACAPQHPASTSQSKRSPLPNPGTKTGCWVSQSDHPSEQRGLHNT